MCATTPRETIETERSGSVNGIANAIVIANTIVDDAASAVFFEPIAAMPDAHRITHDAPRACAVSDHAWRAADLQPAPCLGATGFLPAAPVASTAAAKRAMQRFPVLTRDLST